MLYLNKFISMMLNDLLSYFLKFTKNINKINVNVHAIINFKPGHIF